MTITEKRRKSNDQLIKTILLVLGQKQYDLKQFIRELRYAMPHFLINFGENLFDHRLYKMRKQINTKKRRKV